MKPLWERFNERVEAKKEAKARVDRVKENCRIQAVELNNNIDAEIKRRNLDIDLVMAGNTVTMSAEKHRCEIEILGYDAKLDQYSFRLAKNVPGSRNLDILETSDHELLLDFIIDWMDAVDRKPEEH
jgi:hypothetical protein